MKIKSLLIFLFFIPSGFLFAEFLDDEDVVEGSSREDSREEENRIRQKKQQMKQWLKQLDSLKKNNKKEEPLLALTSKILNEDPDNIQALNTLGVFYLRGGKVSLAKIIFTRALKKHPKNSSLHSNLALIALKEGRKEDAIEAFQKSLSYRYSNYAAAANLGTLYMQAYEYNLALDYLSLAYSRAKQYLSMVHYEVVKTGNNYAVALAWSGDFQKSEDIFEELVKNNPQAVELLLNYAILLGRDLKNTEKAYTLLHKVDMMDRSGRYASSIKALRKYLKGKKASFQKDRFFYLAFLHKQKMVFHKERHGKTLKSL